MPAGSSGRRRRGARAELNYWPAFVDALSTLLLAIVFLISVFMVGQFFLSRELSSRDTVLDRLNRQISELTDLLSLERSSRRTLEENLNSLQSTLQSAEADRERLKNLVESGGAAQSRADELNQALTTERQASGRAMSQIDVLNQQIAAMRRQLAALEEALNASEIPRQGQPGPDRRSRLQAQCGVGPEGAGTGAIPFGFLRPPAPDSRQPAGCADRRRSLRVPVGSAVSRRPGHSASRKRRENSIASPAHSSSLKSRFRRTSPG